MSLIVMQEMDKEIKENSFPTTDKTVCDVEEWLT